MRKGLASLVLAPFLALARPALAQPAPPAPAPFEPLAPPPQAPAPLTEAPLAPTTPPPVAQVPAPLPLAPTAEAPPPPVAPGEPAPSAPLAGWHGRFYLRDPHDLVRLYPGGRVNVDFDGFFGSKVSDVPAASGGGALNAKVYVRRLRLDLAGEFFGFLSAFSSVELAGQPLSNTNGKTETAAGTAGQVPTDGTARFAAVEAASAAPNLVDAWLNLAAGPWLNFMVGQEKSPLSLENRTSDSTTPFLERNLPIRAFVNPNVREIGVTAWGDVGPAGELSYEVGVYEGDGQNRPGVDDKADFIGRAFVRPLVAGRSALKGLQLGVSGRYGVRDPAQVAYDVSPVTTGQGYALWTSTYTDSLGRLVHVIPSGDQSVLGGELRLPVGPVALQAEAYHVASNSREAIDGFQLTHTERLGRMEGIGWYGMLSAWPFGDAFVPGDPGFVRPIHVDLEAPVPAIKRGLELVALVGGINATYDAAARGGSYDSKSPGAPRGPGTAITAYEYAVAGNFWFTSLFRAGLNVIAYHTPGSGTAGNLAQVPGNLGKTPDAGAHLLAEVTARLALQF